MYRLFFGLFALLLSFVLLSRADARPKPNVDDNGAPRLDAHGDPLPPFAVARLGTLRFRHGRPIFSLCYTRDGKTLITGSNDGTIRFWDVAIGKEKMRFDGHERTIYSLALSSDGKTLASGGEDYTVLLWSVANPKQPSLKIEGSYGPVRALAFSPDDKILAAACDDGTIRLWDTDGKLKRTLLGHGGRVTALLFTPDGEKLISAGGDKEVHIWDTKTWRELPPLTGHTGSVATVALSGDGSRLASGSSDGVIVTWELSTGKKEGELRGHSGAIKTLAFSGDGKTLVSGGDDKTIRLWDLNTRQTRHIFSTGPYPPLVVEVSPDDQTLAAGVDYESALRFWDMKTGKEKLSYDGHRGWGRAVVFTPDGKEIITASSNGEVHFWDRNFKMTRRIEDRAGIIGDMAISPDGTLLATAGNGSNRVRMWDVRKGRLIRSFGGRYTNRIWFAPLAFSPDGKMLAHGQTTRVYIYDPRRGAALRTIYNSALGNVTALAFSPEGDELLAGGSKPVIAVWNPNTRKQLRTLPGHTKLTAAAAYAADGRMIATWNGDRSLRVWERSTHKLRRTFYIGPMAGILGYCCVAFSPNSRFLAAGHGDHSVRVWDLATGEALPPLEGHQSWVRGLAFSPDNKLLVSVSDDSTALVWDMEKIGKHSTSAMKLREEDLKKAWDDLGDSGAARSYRAVTILSKSPARSIPYLLKRFRDQPGINVKKLIKDLASPRFRVRELATAKLAKHGRRLEAALKEALQGKLELEARIRIQKLLENMSRSKLTAETLRIPRAVEVLERLGNEDARAALEALANDNANAATSEARAALRRLREK